MMPIFEDVPIDNPIHQIISPLIAIRNGVEERVSGTAFVIGKSYAITASHVLEDYVENYEGTRELGPFLNISFEMVMAIRINGGESFLPLKVLRSWGMPPADIAILAFGIPHDWPEDHKWCLPRLSLLPPRVGTSITSVGFANTDVSRSKDGIPTLDLHPRVAPGKVELIHHEMRDRVRMPFPCFQTNARFDGGMSGGPIFDDSGSVCGVICSSLAPSSPDEPHVSYGSSIWPVVATKIDSSDCSVATGQYRPALELFRSGAISVIGLENVNIKHGENGTYIPSIQYNRDLFDGGSAV